MVIKIDFYKILFFIAVAMILYDISLHLIPLMPELNFMQETIYWNYFGVGNYIKYNTFWAIYWFIVLTILMVTYGRIKE